MSTVDNAIEGTYEHVDLVFDNDGPFDPATYGGDAEKALAVRTAFLTAIPRQTIVDNLIVPLNPKAEVRNSFIDLPGSPNYDDMVANNGSDAYPLDADVGQGQADPRRRRHHHAGHRSGSRSTVTTRAVRTSSL